MFRSLRDASQWCLTKKCSKLYFSKALREQYYITHPLKYKNISLSISTYSYTFESTLKCSQPVAEENLQINLFLLSQTFTNKQKRTFQLATAKKGGNTPELRQQFVCRNAPFIYSAWRAIHLKVANNKLFVLRKKHWQVERELFVILSMPNHWFFRPLPSRLALAAIWGTLASTINNYRHWLQSLSALTIFNFFTTCFSHTKMFCLFY